MCARQWSDLFSGFLCRAGMWPSGVGLGGGHGVSTTSAGHHGQQASGHGRVESWKTQAFSFYFHVSPLSFPVLIKSGLTFLLGRLVPNLPPGDLSDWG